MRYQILAISLLLLLNASSLALAKKETRETKGKDKKGKKGKRDKKGPTETHTNLCIRGASLAQIFDVQKAAKSLTKQADIVGVLDYDPTSSKAQQLKVILEGLSYKTVMQKNLLLASKADLDPIAERHYYKSRLGRRVILSSSATNIGKTSKAALPSQDPDYAVFMSSDSPSKDGIANIRVSPHLKGVTTASEKVSGSLKIITLDLKLPGPKTVLKMRDTPIGYLRSLIHILVATAIPLAVALTAVILLRGRKRVYS